MNKPKKRLLIGVTLANRGGAQVFVYQLASWLHKQGHEVTVMFGPGDWLPEKLTQSSIPWIRLKHMVREIHPYHDALGVLEIRSIIKKLNPDAVHLNSSKMGAVGSVGGWLAKTPNTVYCIGGWVFLESLSGLRKTAYTLIERFTAPFKDWIINLHPGDIQAAQALHIKPKKGLIVIPNGIDIQAMKQNLLEKSIARQELAKLNKTELTDQHIIFGTIANLFPQKDLINYITACKQLSDKNPHARFIILGEGQERKRIEDAIQANNLTSIVFLPGAIENAARYLGGFDAHVLPSSKEGMPFTVLEAMAAQTPNIATDVGAIRWMLDKHGWISPAQNSSALAEAMHNFIQESAQVKTQKTEAAYQHLVNHFQLEDQMKKQEQILVENKNDIMS